MDEDFSALILTTEVQKNGDKINLVSNLLLNIKSKRKELKEVENL